MSPVLNCIPSDPPSDQETYPKTASVASEGSNRLTPPENSPDHLVNNSTESENPCCDDLRTENDEDSSPTNNNSISFNFKKSPSPADGLFLETPNRPWNSSPNYKNYERDHSASPSSCGHRPSPRDSMSPDVSSENSRIPSHASSEAQDVGASPDRFRSPKVRPSEAAGDVSFAFHENRLSSSSFRLSNSLVGDPISSYLQLPGSLLNPFQSPHSFLSNPFIEANDPKLLVGNPGLGLISQQLHHLNGISTSLNKIYPPDIQRMSIQQLHFLQSHLQNLPGLLQPSPYAKYSDPKNHLSMLIQTKRHLTLPEMETEKGKKDVFRSVNAKFKEDSFLKAKKMKGIEVSGKSRKTSVTESMEVDNYEDNNSDSDELLSVGSASPPPKCQADLLRREVTNSSSNPSLNGTTNCLSSVLPNRTANSNGAKKLSNSPLRLQEIVTDGKTTNPSNRTLKFSIDNILKSDFGNEDTAKSTKQPESKKDKESVRTIGGKKKPGSDKESPVDSNQDTANPTPGTETPMLWPAWVYCTRYSDRPSSEVSKTFWLQQHFTCYQGGPRTRRSKNKDKNPDEKRPRTAFSGDQLSRLKHEFAENRYLTEMRRQDLARELGLNEAQIKIWFQNKRAKMKKARGEKNPLALQLMAQGLYNHSTVPLTKEEEEAAAAELSD